MATCYFAVKSSSALSASTETLIGTLKARYPKVAGVFTLASPVTASNINALTDGQIKVRAAINANTTFYFGGTYIFA